MFIHPKLPQATPPLHLPPKTSVPLQHPDPNPHPTTSPYNKNIQKHGKKKTGSHGISRDPTTSYLHPLLPWHSGCQALVNQVAFRAASALKRFMGSLLSSCCSNSWASIEMALRSSRESRDVEIGRSWKLKPRIQSLMDVLYYICVYPGSPKTIK